MIIKKDVRIKMNADVVKTIMTLLSYKEFVHLCRTNKQLLNMLDESFWIHQFHQDQLPLFYYHKLDTSFDWLREYIKVTTCQLKAKEIFMKAAPIRPRINLYCYPKDAILLLSLLPVHYNNVIVKKSKQNSYVTFKVQIIVKNDNRYDISIIDYNYQYDKISIDGSIVDLLIKLFYYIDHLYVDNGRGRTTFKKPGRYTDTYNDSYEY